MKFTNTNAEAVLVLTGIFKDPTRGVKIDKSGSVTFHNNRLVPNVLEVLATPIYQGVVKVEPSDDADTEDDAFVQATFSTKRVDTTPKFQGQPYMTPGSGVGPGYVPNPIGTAQVVYTNTNLFNGHGFGIEENLSRMLHPVVNPGHFPNGIVPNVPVPLKP